MGSVVPHVEFVDVEVKLTSVYNRSIYHSLITSKLMFGHFLDTSPIRLHCGGSRSRLNRIMFSQIFLSMNYAAFATPRC